MPVTLMYPAKAIRQNEMPFGRDTCVVRSIIVLDGALVSTGGSEPPVVTMSQQLQSINFMYSLDVSTTLCHGNAAYCQITVVIIATTATQSISQFSSFVIIIVMPL